MSARDPRIEQLETRWHLSGSSTTVPIPTIRSTMALFNPPLRTTLGESSYDLADSDFRLKRSMSADTGSRARPPTIAKLVASGRAVAGSSITLMAKGVRARSSQVEYVNYYFDSDHKGQLDPNDTLLGSSAVGAVFAFAAVGFKDGPATFFAQAVDIAGQATAHAATARVVIYGTPVSAPPIPTPTSPVAPPPATPTPEVVQFPGAGQQVQQIRSWYGVNEVAADGGAGEVIAIIDAFNDPNIQADVAIFDQTMGLPACQLTVVNQSGQSVLPGAQSPGPNSGCEEISLDVEWAHAIAPRAGILLVEANNYDTDNLTSAIQWASNQPGVSVVSMSFGNSYKESPFPDSLFTTPANHQGITFVASSGDDGAYPGGFANYPAASPNVLAVGGTMLVNAAGQPAGPGTPIVNEIAWSGSGGGFGVDARPGYQPGGTEPGGGAVAGANREVPDVALDATGLRVYDSYDSSVDHSSWIAEQGTSASAPMWAALIAIANEMRADRGLGSLDGPSETLPTLYELPSGDFRDITSGGNGEYSAQIGYDLVTGLGSPNANLLVPALAGVYPKDQYLTGDFTGGGKTELAVRRGDEITYQTVGIKSSGAQEVTVPFWPGDLVDQYLVGDWNGDGKDELAVRIGNQIYYQDPTAADPTAIGLVSFGNGNAEDQYLVGDFTGIGRDELAVVRPNPANGAPEIFYQTNWIQSTGAQVATASFGNPGDTFLVGDFTNFGSDELAVVRPNPVNGAPEIFYQTMGIKSTGADVATASFGNPGDTFLVGDFTGIGRDELAVQRGNEIIFQTAGITSTGAQAGAVTFGNG